MDTASFVGFLIARKAIQELGLPLKDFFIYFDDTEYSLRMCSRGIMFTVTDSKVVHGMDGGGSNKLSGWKKPLDWRTYYEIRNQIYICKKYCNPGLVFYLILFARILRRIGVTLLIRHSKVKSMKILLWGTLDGLQGKLGKNIDFLPD